MYFDNDSKQNENEKKEYEAQRDEAFKNNLKRYEENKDYFALYLLAIHYANYRNEDCDMKKAYDYMSRLKNDNFTMARYHLACYEMEGKGCLKDVDMAIDDFLAFLHDGEEAYRQCSLVRLAYIYLFDEDHFSVEKGIYYLNKAILMSIENPHDFTKDINPSHYDENELKYQYFLADRRNNNLKFAKEVMDQFTSNTLTSLEPFSDEVLSHSILSHMVRVYLYLNHYTEGNNEKIVKEYFSILKEKLDEEDYKQFSRSDYPAYYVAGEERKFPLRPDGYFLNEKETKDYLNNKIEESKFETFDSISFLLQAYMGFYRYIDADYEQAKEYAYKARALHIPQGNYCLALIYHDGLENNIVDKEKAISLINEFPEFAESHILLAYYALLDDNDKEKASFHIIEYVKKEIEHDRQIYQQAKHFFDERESLEEVINNPILSTMEKGFTAMDNGMKAYEEKDYIKAKECFENCIQNDPLSQANAMIALLAINGYGTEVDIDSALSIIKELTVDAYIIPYF